jgi:membrane protein
MNFKQHTLKIWRESQADDVLGNAAKLAYFFLLALFPALIFLTSIIGFLPDIQDSIFRSLARVAPADAMNLVQKTLTDVVNNRSGPLLSFGLLASLWSASSGVASLIDSLNAVDDRVSRRPFWKRRLKAIGLTLGTALLVSIGSLLVMMGHRVGAWLAHTRDLSSSLAIGSAILGYIVGFILLFAGIFALYRFGPEVRHRRKEVLPGTVFAAAGIVVGSLLFSIYVRVGPSASATYGSLGAVITLMLWLYLVSIMLLVGGEINSELGGPVVDDE